MSKARDWRNWGCVRGAKWAGLLRTRSCHVRKGVLCCSSFRPNSNGVWWYSVAKLVHLSSSDLARHRQRRERESSVTAAERRRCARRPCNSVYVFGNKCIRMRQSQGSDRALVHGRRHPLTLHPCPPQRPTACDERPAERGAPEIDAN